MWMAQIVAFAIAFAVAWWLVRHARAVIRGDYRHPKDVRRPWWFAGHGTHGSTGGQVPPLIPDSDPDNRIA
jgi:hypothetical protein